jgi:hypothetical protein
MTLLRLLANSDIFIPFAQVISIAFPSGYVGSREENSRIIRTFNPASGLGSQVPYRCARIAKTPWLCGVMKLFFDFRPPKQT